MREIITMPSVALAAVATAATPALAANVDIAVTGPVVELQVSQQVLGDPDKAMVSAGVTSRAQTAVAAMQANAREMDAVLKRLKDLGVPDDRVQTSGITLNPQYNYRNNQPPQFIGYDATNTVSIELRDLERVGPVLDSLVAAGATNLNGPAWGIVDDTAPKAQARKAAFEAAFAQARDYARMAGYSDARLLAVEESLGYSQPMYDRAITAQASAPPPPAAVTPTRPGRVATQVTLIAKFELVK
ncbi:SIMPL domain-containing protein [Croceicoccus gelatinilyticus]|uniref:SIMPL domain-containing protein n=1 Tax=Croceicoccus gelatinilyticus TaxID=2835536 RepID=UPI001BCDF939|nr:SIMPL domain-containing protein [Croceicoccus gelatinilyticus]MBS7670120.1 SIMPL domain-containing protein [Croceicoccus gelatinilyticus]